MKRITINKLLSWNPCEDYETREQVLSITKGKTSLTTKEISNLKIPALDRIWVLLRPEILGEKKYKEIGYKIADRAVRKHCLKCGIKSVEEWAKEWLSGKDKTHAAAYAAADAVAYAADAAAVAVYAADADTACAAVYAAAATAYAATAYDAAYAAERKWQLKLIKTYLNN